MKHYLNLWDKPFRSIASGDKTIEMRLYDEKRKLISIGDEIEFENKDTHDKVNCKVINLYRFKNFDELYKHFDKTKLGYKANEIAKPSDMSIYYSSEKINLYGVLGIEIELI